MDESGPLSGHPDSLRQAFLWALLETLVLILIAPSVGDAQVTTSITSTTGAGSLGTTVTQAGNLYDITGGTRPGNGPNLFHSFGDFTVGGGDIANFLNNTQLPTSNVLGRVTGGTSNIDGTIQTTGFGNANLFLINPAGIILGPHGSFDVGGSVSLTTAQYLRLFDSLNGVSAIFYANPASDSLANSVLAVAPVVDFGFLSPAAYGFLTAPDPSATITVTGSMLRVPEGHSLSLVGGDITIQAQTFADGTIQASNFTAPGGQLNLVSVASPGEVFVSNFQTGPNIDGASFTTMGTVTLKEGAMLDVSGQLDEFGTPIGNGNSGTVLVRGGQLVMDASTIQASTVGKVDGAKTAVDLQVSKDLTLSNGSAIYTFTFGAGRGGGVQLTAETLTIKDAPQSILTATVDGDGVGGDVVLNVGKLSLMGDSSIQSQTQSFTPGLGHGGNVTIQGLQGAEFGAARSVILSSGSSLLSQTFGMGEGGRVAITSKSLMMDGAATVNATTFAEGRGGDIVVNVQQARLSEGATILTQSGSGELNAQAAATVTVQGLQGAESMADSVRLSGFGSGIISDTSGTARSGDVAVYAKTVSLTDGAVIQTGTLSNTGAGGNVTIVADSIDFSSRSRITSLSSAGNAGQVAITADELTLDDVSIESSSNSSGRGGDVVLNVGTVSLSNSATINSSAENTGVAGNINILASGSVTMTNGSTITASSAGSGNAGDISINSKEVPGNTFEMWHSTISTSAALADGGNIGIFATNMVRLTDSIITSSVGNETKTDTFGGNVTIDPQFVILQNSQIRANAFAGSGGAIDIIATSAYIPDPLSIVSASSTLGISGPVNIQAPLQNVGGELTALTQEFSSAAALLAQQCAARAADGKFSTFVVAAREGLPGEPGGYLASPSLTTELLGSSLSGLNPQTQLSAVTSLFPKYDARPIQLARFGEACHRQ